VRLLPDPRTYNAVHSPNGNNKKQAISDFPSQPGDAARFDVRTAYNSVYSQCMMSCRSL
jgi:hypothetical protein